MATTEPPEPVTAPEPLTAEQRIARLERGHQHNRDRFDTIEYGQRWRTIASIFILVVAVVSVWRLNVNSQDDLEKKLNEQDTLLVDAQRDACSRSNPAIRGVLAGFILDAQARNIAAAESQTGTELESTEQAIRDYEERFMDMVEPLRAQGLQLYPGTETAKNREVRVKAVYADCEKAYPPPIPPD